MFDTEILNYEVQVKGNDDFYTVFTCFSESLAVDYARRKVAKGFVVRIVLFEALVGW